MHLLCTRTRLLLFCWLFHRQQSFLAQHFGSPGIDVIHRVEWEENTPLITAHTKYDYICNFIFLISFFLENMARMKGLPDSIANQPDGPGFPQETLLETPPYEGKITLLCLFFLYLFVGWSRDQLPYVGKIYCICINSNHLEGKTWQQEVKKEGCNKYLRQNTSRVGKKKFKGKGATSILAKYLSGW